jgi:hypothetical protein
MEATPFTPNHALGYCLIFSDNAKKDTIFATKDISTVLYSGAFLLGCWNIWAILIQQGYYKSVYLTM